MLYEYRCNECGYQFEVLKPVSKREEPTREPCPECGKENCVVQLAASGVAMIDSMRLGMKKPDGAFQENLSRIHQNVPGSELGDKMSRN